MSDPAPPPFPELIPLGSAAVAAYGRAVHRLELEGLDNLPASGGALLVVYHSFCALDVWMFGAEVYRQSGRLIRFLADRFLFQTPALRHLVRWSGSVPGNREDAVRLLREGHLVGVAPGGVREALAGRADHYRVLWGERLGFAHVALDAQVPIIPIFTENAEEIYRAPGAQSAVVQALYERTRVPVVPVVGLGLLPLPVKLRSHIGAPLLPRPGETPEALRDRARDALQALIDQHQDLRRPRVLRALAARVRDQ